MDRMDRKKVFNFSAGPSMLPEEVLQRASSEMTNYNGLGMSVMEMSHRSSVYVDIFNSVKEKLRNAMSIPDSHEVLFLQGGATLQFSMIPMNLIGDGCADYAVTGNFASAAYKEAGKYGNINLAASTEDCGHTRIPAQNELKLSDNAKYFYYCANNTIYGTEWNYIPEMGKTPLVCDMSSNILSRDIDVSKYGIIFAGAQKNMAPAGLTVVIIDKELELREKPYTPQMMSYKTMINKDSMLNTPPCYNIYMLGLMLDWLKSEGGVGEMEKRSLIRSGLIYDYLDSSRLFKAKAQPEARSRMNVTFTTGDSGLDDKFVKAGAEQGFLQLKGHRVTGGMRASVYNAMPIDGVKALIEYMDKFEAKNNV